MLMTDRNLLDAYRRGERGAMEEVYRLYVTDVEKLLRRGFTFSSNGKTFRFAGFASAFERQEMVQETFIRAFGERARTGYSGLRPFKPYLLGIARNLIIDEFRRRRREMSLFTPEDGAEERGLDLVDDALLEQSPVGAWARRAHNPERATTQQRTNTLMRAFVAELDEDAQRLVHVHFIEGKSQQETADILNTSRNAVRKEGRLLRLKLLRFMKSRGHIHNLDPDELLMVTGHDN